MNAYSHVKSLHKKEISNQKRFLTLGPDGEYKEQFGHEFDVAKVPRGQRHWLGKYKRNEECGSRRSSASRFRMRRSRGWS